MYTVKLTAVGNSVGVIFPKELLAKLGLDKGDTLHVHEAPDGMRLSTTDPEFETQMEIGRALMKKWRNVLHELAK